MKKITKPNRVLNPAYRKVTLTRSQINAFKSCLTNCLEHIKINEQRKESEENIKKYIGEFLQQSFYQEHLINTKDRIDLAIYLGKDANSPIGVLLEAKRPSNAAEFLTPEQINRKALQELLLYYLKERVTAENNQIKQLIATNGYEWYFFKGEDFYEYFYKNKKLLKEYHEFIGGQKDTSKNELFYQEIAKKYIAEVEQELPFLYLDLRSVEPLLSLDNTDDDALVALYKVFSPVHLLGQAYGNDSNLLNKSFYYELLHIIGLEEDKEGGKKVIRRKAKGQRQDGALLENVIFMLDERDHLRKVERLGSYGNSREEQLFGVALELCLTWVNRVLFLKLLESQLLAYHKGDRRYRFLHSDFVTGFDDLEELFFSALAKKPTVRSERLRTKYQWIPYLNSSLFEMSELEDGVLQVSNLKDLELALYDKTVLKDGQLKRLTGSLPALEYLFRFLDAYDFSGEEGNMVDESNQAKSLISASVLGLIFEKINGYKDGSFYTPAYITMYMSREALRRAVLQKFNARYAWRCQRWDDLREDLKDRVRQGDRDQRRQEANALINSLKICDPAVGSGHFLVSCLNELIAIKSELGLLCDSEGKRLNVAVYLDNDELAIEDEDGELFAYRPDNKASRRIQEALFHEKQRLIENCLFGVDINANSVKICRLRLWIELLKNAYYTDEEQLQTLPNIDINIKTGNSLISRFALEDDLKTAFRSAKNAYSLHDYQQAVTEYKRTNDKERKRAILDIIATVKAAFRDTLDSKFLKRLSAARGKYEQKQIELQNLEAFGETISKKEREELKRLLLDFERAQAEKEEILHNAIYQNAFEWRFEFPEVLDEQGDFVGFDVVIGNPPYMRVQEIQLTQPLEKNHYEANYTVAKAAYDLANLFFERAVRIANKNASNAFIFPHKFFNSSSGEAFRNYLIQGKFVDKITHFGANMIFDEADTYTCIAQFSAIPNDGFYCYKAAFKEDFSLKMLHAENYGYTNYSELSELSSLYGTNQWILLGSATEVNLFKKIYQESKKIEDCIDLFVGLQTSKDELFISKMLLEKEDTYLLDFFKLNAKYEVEKKYFKPMLMGKDVQRYSHLETDLYVFFPYDVKGNSFNVAALKDIAQNYPLTYAYIMENEKIFKARESGKAGKMEHWHAYIYPKNITKFEQNKLSSMEICAKHPNVTLNASLYHPTTVYSWVKKENILESYEYFLAIANSKLLWWFLMQTGDTLQGDARRFKTNYLNPFPLPKQVDADKELQIVEKIKIILTTKRETPTADTTALEAEIDRLVYGLYGLTEEEIAVIEGA